MFGNQKHKSLIVVSNKSTGEFADYLIQLISSDDEKSGIVSNDMHVVVWDYKMYEDNKGTLTSNTYVLFVGIPEVNTTRMNNKFNKFGMAYGWLGKRGYLNVDGNLNNEEYCEFKSFAGSYEKSYDVVDEDELVAKITETAHKTVEKIEDTTNLSLPKTKKGKILGGIAAAVALVTPAAPVVATGICAGVAAAGVGKKMNISKNKDRNLEVNSQRYELLTYIFYYKALKNFLEA